MSSVIRFARLQGLPRPSSFLSTFCFPPTLQARSFSHFSKQRGSASPAALLIRPQQRQERRYYSRQQQQQERRRQGYSSYNRFAGYFQRLRYDRKTQVLTAVGVSVPIVYYFTHLQEVPVTGRVRYLSVSDKQLKDLADMAYEDLLKKFRSAILPKSHPTSLAVERVARRIIGSSDFPQLKTLPWEFHVVQSPEANAFVLPNGKVFVFTGILPIMKDEAGMATVLGHEISHVLAKHTAENVSKSTVLGFAALLASLVLGVDLWVTSMVKDMVALPFSRTLEAEADHIGLILMSKACYDPHEAVQLWERFAKYEKQPEFMQFFSTHPSPARRTAQIKELLPVADRVASSSCDFDPAKGKLQPRTQTQDVASIPLGDLNRTHPYHRTEHTHDHKHTPAPSNYPTTARKPGENVPSTRLPPLASPPPAPSSPSRSPSYPSSSSEDVGSEGVRDQNFDLDSDEAAVVIVFPEDED